MAGYYWKRVGYVEVGDGQGSVATYGVGDNALDFKFNIKKPLAAQRIEASIGILGLSRETIHSLVCWQPWNIAVAKERPVKVYAGYEESGAQLLFEGYIVEARPTQPPNMWLNIKADNLSYADKKLEKQSKRDVMFKQYVGDLAKRCGWTADIASDVPDKQLKSVCFNGTASQIPEYIEKLADVYAFMSDDTILKVVRRLPGKYPAQRGKHVLDADHGLLGIASLTWDSLTAKMRLDTSIKLNDFVRVESELYPSNATGDYLVNEIDYNGHLRGQEWETVIQAWNYTNESQGIRPNWTGGRS